MKTGIFGGSFNPVHKAHIELALFFKNKLLLDKVMIVPAYCSPFKNREDNILDDKHRLEMLKSAFQNYNDFSIETFELDRKETSFTIDTIDYLISNHPKDTIFHLLIGTDQWLSFDKWKSWKEILQKVIICVAGRNGNQILQDNPVEDYCKKNNIQVIYLDSPLFDISSENIRNMVKNGENFSKYVSNEVAEYIKVNNLYL